MRKGLVHIYTGEGKGKTTAALGLGLRAAGCGIRVCVLQFFKDGVFPCGESEAVEKLGNDFKFMRFGISHPMFKKTNIPDLALKLKHALAESKKIIKSKKYGLVILDEVLIAAFWDALFEKEILDIIRSRPREVELVLTGRNATKKLIKAADYVTYMKCVKHPFDGGVKARKGIEF